MVGPRAPCEDEGMEEAMSPEEREVRRRFESNELYKDFGVGLEDLEAARMLAKDRAFDFNSVRPSDLEGRQRALADLFGSVGNGVFIEQPVHVAYGKHTFIGDDVYVNFGLKVVDDSEVHIGNRVMFGPNVTIVTAGHPVHPELRGTGYQYSARVTIEDDVWLGSGATILSGVTVGRGSVVAAGAVVTANVPPMTVVGGVPAKTIRSITEADNDWRYRPPGDIT